MFDMSVNITHEPKIALAEIQGNISKAVVGGFKDVLFFVQRAIQNEIVDWTSQTSARKSGDLSRSFKAETLVVSALIIRGGVFSSLVYARIHNEGGKIVPKKAKALAMPFPGVVIPQGMGPRDFPNLVFIPSNKANTIGVLGEKLGKGKFRPLFLLRRSVTIKPKHYLDKAAKKALPEVEVAMTNLIQAALRS